MGIPTGMLNKLVTLSSPTNVALEGARNVTADAVDTFKVWAYVMRRASELTDDTVFKQVTVMIENTPQTLNIRNDWTATLDGQVYFVDSISADGVDTWVLELKNRE